MSCTRASTETGAGTLPEVTEAVTSPFASVLAELGASVTPPGAPDCSRLKSTSTPALPLPVLSTTLNFTTELCGSDEPAPWMPITAGDADTNCMLLAAGVATVMVVLTEAPVTDAVMASLPEAQLLSL